MIMLKMGILFPIFKKWGFSIKVYALINLVDFIVTYTF